MKALVVLLAGMLWAAGAWAGPPEPGPKVLVIGVEEPVDVVAEFANGQLTGWHAAKAEEAADAVRFKIALKPDDSGGMIATIENLGPSGVKLKMELISPDGKGWMETSSCPVRARMSNFEMWPHPIGKLLITDAHILKPGEKMACT